jgi:hypothetical protein
VRSVDALLKRAQEILDVAANGADVAELFILVGSSGDLRILDRVGWSLQSIRAEFGAQEVFRVSRSSGVVRVEGSDGSERCLIQRKLTGFRMLDLPGFQTASYAVIPQIPSC